MHNIVQDYYGNQLKHTDDLKTNACCDNDQVPSWLKPPLSRIHPEILSRYYGCGLVCPPLPEHWQIQGCTSYWLEDSAVRRTMKDSLYWPVITSLVARWTT